MVLGIIAGSGSRFWKTQFPISVIPGTSMRVPSAVDSFFYNRINQSQINKKSSNFTRQGLL